MTYWQRVDGLRVFAMIDLCSHSRTLDAPMLEGLSHEGKQAFLAACTERVLRNATAILFQGEPTAGCYLVAAGQVEVTYVDALGNAVIVHNAMPGEMLGEVEALSGRPCACTCVAAPGTTVLFCPTAVLTGHLPPHLLVRNLCTSLHKRMVRESRLRAADHHYSVEHRLRLHLGRLDGGTGGGPADLRISQTQLAVLVGCSRQTVNPILGRLRDEGVIELGRGTIRVLDRERLLDGTALPE